MKTLFLLRHATAEPEGLMDDASRLLTAEGHRQGKLLAQYWQDKDYSVDYAMCSIAERARETIGFIQPYLGPNVIEISKDYYAIEEGELLKHVRTCHDDQEKVIYVGHNPGVAFFAMRLASKPLEQIVQGYKPCTLCVFQFDVEHWSEIDWQAGDLVDFWTPSPPPED